MHPGAFPKIGFRPSIQTNFLSTPMTLSQKGENDEVLVIVFLIPSTNDHSHCAFLSPSILASFIAVKTLFRKAPQYAQEKYIVSYGA